MYKLILNILQYALANTRINNSITLLFTNTFIFMCATFQPCCIAVIIFFLVTVFYLRFAHLTHDKVVCVCLYHMKFMSTNIMV